jgi:hypothetical protein
MGEGGLGAESLGGVAGGDQQLPGGVDPDPGQGQQGGGGRTDQRPQLGVELGEFGLELLPAAGQVPRVALVAAVVLVSGPGRMAAQAPTSAWSCAQAAGGAALGGRCRARRGVVRRRPPWL